MRRSFKADIGQMTEIYAFVSSFLTERGVSAEYVTMMEMAADEIFSNIVKYAYDKETPDSERFVDIELDVRDDLIEMTFADIGLPFDPLSVPAPDLTPDERERRAGGLGIFLTRSAMDDMRYSRKGDSNMLTLSKSTKHV
jgi:anti-sigma regulatory factor (Ser/Thr protein kinase)